MVEKVVAANGVQLCVEEFGDREHPAVLLIQGANGSMLRWREDLCTLIAGRGRHVIRYDNRDTGRSTTYPPGQPAYDLEDLADDAVGVLDVLGIAEAHLVGMSMGGMIAQLVAIRHPERVRTITPMMTTPNPAATMTSLEGGREGLEQLPGATDAIVAAFTRRMNLDWLDPSAVVDDLVEFFRLLTGTRYPFDEAWEREVAEAELNRTSSAASGMNHALAVASTPPWHSRLREVRAPALVVHGTEDPIVPYPHGQALAAALPASRLLTLAGVGHELPRGVWDAVVPALVLHTSR